MTEHEIIGGVIDYLNSHGCFVWRQMNEGSFDSDLAAKALAKEEKTGFVFNYVNIRRVFSNCYRRVPYSIKGVADVIGWELETGRFVAVEVKTKNDNIKKDQDAWLRAAKQAGCKVYVARSVTDFIRRWESDVFNEE
jgi:hypothetical protein